jgi:hypothetical protein
VLSRGHNRIDADNLAAEIADSGRRELRAPQHDIEGCLEHLLKRAANPDGVPVGHRRREARTFAKHARRALAPDMRRQPGKATAWRQANSSAADDLSDYR